eukprot:230297_1
MSQEERFDGMFLNCAQQMQGIDPLMECFFGFLRRKTDFYRGVPLEMAENKVISVLRAQAKIIEEEELYRKKKKAQEELRRKKEQKKKDAELEATKMASKKCQDGDDDESNVIEMGEDGSYDSTQQKNSKAKKDTMVMPNEEQVKDKEEDSGLQPEGNGGKTDTYVWTQTLGELSLTVPVPPGTKSRDVVCNITSKKLKVGMKGQPLIVDGELYKKVIVDDSFWTLEDSKDISIILQKDNKMEWWRYVIKGDAEIDTTKVQPENSKLDDLDMETRQTVEKMMFDQRQKAMGKPTADEMQKEDMLQKFMEQHPEMDFSNVKMS